MKTNTRLELRPKYRPDIDGLRAIGVLSVVFYHAFPGWIKGGFIGVDIFFVISGYLISIIIFENLDNKKFSFFDFYSRRIKRIFPALIFVLTSSFLFGWFALLADEYKQLGKHIAGGAGFVSNLILWNEVGYFDNSAETKPLLHLWSLGIEEQFYIIWPLLMWIAWRRNFNLLTVIIFVAATSFILNIKGVKQDPIADFYSPQTRFWELLSGSILAWFSLYTKERFIDFKNKINAGMFMLLYGRNAKTENKGHTLANTLSVFGILLLSYGFWRIDKDLSFPGLWVLVPVIGAILILMGGPKSWLNCKVLSHKAVVWFGLISFPLYLWHWPLLSFARIIEGGVPALYIRIASVVISIFLAWITYWLIEKPMRSQNFNNTKVVLLIIFMVLIGYVGFNTFSRDGLGFRANATLKGYEGDIGHLDYHKFIAEKYYTCKPDLLATEALRWEGFIRCMQSKSSANQDIALVGDSHAEHLFYGIANALASKNVVFYIKGSPPFIENKEFSNIFKSIIASTSIKQVIVTMNWMGRNGLIPGSTLQAELIKVIDPLSASGKIVYLTDDIPTFPFSPEKCKGKRWMATQNTSCEITIEESIRQRSTYIEALNSVIKSRPNVRVLQVGKYLCGDKVCSMVKGGEILYRDNNHLNLNGSLYIGRKLIEDNPIIN